MEPTIREVQAYYDGDVQAEWNRLSEHPFEFLITMEMLKRYIHPGDRVLDIGGGPGRYSIALAKLGCHVTLLDLSPNNVAFAKAEAARQGVAIRALAGDAREADRLIAERDFDHVLLMGPLYHLLEEADRERAVRAALATLKPGGLFYASFILMFGGMIYMMRECPELIDAESEQVFLQQIRVDGGYSGPAFTQAHLESQKDIEPFMARFPLREVTLLGQEGILAPNMNTLLPLDEAKRAQWVELAVRLCERRDLLSYSEHAMYVGQKE